MATNPNIAAKALELTQSQLNTIGNGGSVIKDGNTYTADTGTMYLTEDTSVLFEAQNLTSQQQAQARTNIGADTVSVSNSGTSTDEVSYITINGVEKKIGGSGGSVDVDNTTITENASNKIQAVGITNGTTPILYNDIYGAITTTWEV